MKVEAAGHPKTSVVLYQTIKLHILAHTLHMQHAHNNHNGTINNFQLNDVSYNSTPTAYCPEP
jgi:hypothetical protein